MLQYQLAVKAQLDLLMSPFLFPFSLQRPAPVAGCLFAGAVALAPAAWTNLERAHEPSARNQPVGNQQPANNQPSKLALVHQVHPSSRTRQGCMGKAAFSPKTGEHRISNVGLSGRVVRELRRDNGVRLTIGTRALTWLSGCPGGLPKHHDPCSTACTNAMHKRHASPAGAHPGDEPSRAHYSLSAALPELSHLCPRILLFTAPPFACRARYSCSEHLSLRCG